LTEVKDVADCLEKNTKRRGDSKRRTPQRNSQRPANRPCWGLPLAEKVKCLAENAYRGNLDIAGALACIAANDLQDKVIGKLSGTANRNLNQSPYNPRRGLGIGLGAGGYSTRMR